MTKLKKNVFRIALAVLIILLVFTLFSKTVYNLMLPEVKKESASKGALKNDASGKTYTLVPLNSVFLDAEGSCVYTLEETETLWGKGYTVKRIGVEYIGCDYLYAAVEGNGISSVISSASKALYDGANVKVAK